MYFAAKKKRTEEKLVDQGAEKYRKNELKKNRKKLSNYLFPSRDKMTMGQMSKWTK